MTELPKLSRSCRILHATRDLTVASPSHFEPFKSSHLLLRMGQAGCYFLSPGLCNDHGLVMLWFEEKQTRSDRHLKDECVQQDLALGGRSNLTHAAKQPFERTFAADLFFEQTSRIGWITVPGTRGRSDSTAVTIDG